jgi:hypothetical protein
MHRIIDIIIVGRLGYPIHGPHILLACSAGKANICIKGIGLATTLAGIPCIKIRGKLAPIALAGKTTYGFGSAYGCIALIAGIIYFNTNIVCAIFRNIIMHYITIAGR